MSVAFLEALQTYIVLVPVKSITKKIKVVFQCICYGDKESAKVQINSQFFLIAKNLFLSGKDFFVPLHL